MPKRNDPPVDPADGQPLWKKMSNTPSHIWALKYVDDGAAAVWSYTCDISGYAHRCDFDDPNTIYQETNRTFEGTSYMPSDYWGVLRKQKGTVSTYYGIYSSANNGNGYIYI